MIEIKAESVNKDGEQGVETTCSIQGGDNQILNEAVAVIQGVMCGVKQISPMLHLTLLMALREEPDVFTGNTEDKGSKSLEESKASDLARLMSRNILKRGVN